MEYFPYWEILPTRRQELLSYIASQDHSSTQSYFGYKRVNHCQELINQYNGSQRAHIPTEVYDTLRSECRRHRIPEDSLTYDVVKYYLKKHSYRGYNRYYENIPLILEKLTGGRTQPLIDKKLARQLRELFMALCFAFDKVELNGRKSFLGYGFVLHHLLMVLGRDDYCSAFPQLKSVTKNHEQSRIFNEMCGILGWPKIGKGTLPQQRAQVIIARAWRQYQIRRLLKSRFPFPELVLNYIIQRVDLKPLSYVNYYVASSS